MYIHRHVIESDERYLPQPERRYRSQCQVCGELVPHVEEVGGDVCRYGTFVCDDCMQGYLVSRADECTKGYIKEHEPEFYLSWWWDNLTKEEKLYYAKQLYALAEHEKQRMERDFCLEQDGFPDFEKGNLI